MTISLAPAPGVSTSHDSLSCNYWGSRLPFTRQSCRSLPQADMNLYRNRIPSTIPFPRQAPDLTRHCVPLRSMLHTNPHSFIQLCCLRRHLLDVLKCTPPSPPPCRLVLFLNANWYKYKGNMAYWCSIALRKDRWNHPVISRSPSAYAGPDLGSGTPGTTQSSRDGSPGRSAMLAQGTAFCTCDLDFSQVLPWDRIMLNLANTTGHIRPQTVGKTLRVVPSCLQYPEVPCVGAGLSPKVLEGATRETLFLLTTHQYPSYEHGVGVSQANRRETRKLGLLLSDKSSEVERERMEPLERNKRVDGDIPTQMLIPNQIRERNTPVGQQPADSRTYLSRSDTENRTKAPPLVCRHDNRSRERPWPLERRVKNSYQ